MQVALMCFVFAGILGVGGVGFLIFNGLMFGSTMAYCTLHGFDDALGAFVVAHGVLELSLIVCATFQDLFLVAFFFMRPYSLFKVRFKKAMQDSMIVIAGIIPWFLLCGIVESFISPLPDFSYAGRWAIGAAISFLFWSFTFAAVSSEAVIKNLKRN